MNKIIFDKKTILKNIKDFKQGIRELNNITLLFPVKSCTNVDILKLFYQNGFYFDVSNKNELEIVSNFKGFKSFVGPICKTIQTNRLKKYIMYYDSIDDYLSSKIPNDKKGLRVNFNHKKAFSYSRFGIDFSNIPQNIAKQLQNVHFHLTDSRSKKFLKILENNFDDIIKKCVNLKNINIGGGYDELDTQGLVDFVKKLYKKLKNSQYLFIECGDFWFKGSGKLVAEVLNVINVGTDFKVVILATSKDCNLKWSAPVYIEKNDEKTKSKIKYYFYGASCFEKDLISSAKTHDVINAGDFIEFGNISHYSVEWNTSFNGIKKIEVLYE